MSDAESSEGMGATATLKYSYRGLSKMEKSSSNRVSQRIQSARTASYWKKNFRRRIKVISILFLSSSHITLYPDSIRVLHNSVFANHWSEGLDKSKTLRLRLEP